MSKLDQAVLLIADSQISSLAVLRNSLAAAAPSAHILSADTGRSALDQARSAKPQVVVADMRLNDMSGLKLLLKMKAKHPEALTIMMSECGSQEARKMCLEAGVDFFFEKPVDVNRLTGMLGTAPTEEASVFRGTLDNLSVPDVLQLIICRPSPMLMRVDSPRGSGGIEIEEGRVIHARANGLVGENAFYELVGWTEGHFEVVDVVCAEERTIALPLPQLLLKAATRSPVEQDIIREAGELLQEVHEPFFPPEEQAPDVSHVWAPMANYTRPQVQRTRRQPTYTVDTVRPNLPSMNAFKYQEDEPISALRLRKTSRPTARFTPDSAPQPPQMRGSGRRGASARPRRRSVAPAGRRVLLASVAAVLMLFVGVRYSGIMSSEYGREVMPVLDTMFREFLPKKDAGQATNSIQASQSYADGTIRITDRNLKPGANQSSLVADGVGPNGVSAKAAKAYGVSLSSNADLAGSANVIGVNSALYTRLGLEQNPWVEVIGPTGKRIGAMAIDAGNSRTPIVVGQDMYDTLSHKRVDLTHVKLQKVRWVRTSTETALSFQSSQSLPGQYCEYWYSIGISLGSMRSMGLTPGMSAVVRGPAGYQSVRVQLVDRGHGNEIWLSQPVRDAVGASSEDVQIKLFPKT